MREPRIAGGFIHFWSLDCSSHASLPCCTGIVMRPSRSRERECCLVLNSVSSTPQWIRQQPEPHNVHDV